MSDIAGQRRFANAVGDDQNDVARGLQEIELHQFFDQRLIALRGPGPVEIAQGFEATDMRSAETTFETTPGPFVFFPLDQGGQPCLIADRIPVLK